MGRTIALVMLLGAAATSAWSQEVGDVGGCFVSEGDDRKMCEASSKQLRRDIPKAIAKDYQAQRNVSFCLADGCNGAIQPNRMLGCAWRLVILASGSSKVDSTDTGFLDAYCSRRLDETEKSAAEEQARQLFKKVYRREMRRVPW